MLFLNSLLLRDNEERVRNRNAIKGNYLLDFCPPAILSASDTHRVASDVPKNAYAGSCDKTYLRIS
jgi:hypothetical protein